MFNSVTSKGELRWFLSIGGIVRMGNLFAEALEVALPQCCSTAGCCTGASPSVPYHQLFKKAASGEAFARNFLSIFLPHSDHETVKKLMPGLVERTLAAAEKQSAFNGPEDVVFYQCRYLTPAKKCGIWEDRPQLCRDYPDTPFVVMTPGCAFEDWGKECRTKFSAMKTEVDKLKGFKEELAKMHAHSSISNWPVDLAESPTATIGLTDETVTALLSEELLETLSVLLSMTPLYLVTPAKAMYFLH